MRLALRYYYSGLALRTATPPPSSLLASSSQPKLHSLNDGKVAPALRVKQAAAAAVWAGLHSNTAAVLLRQGRHAAAATHCTTGLEFCPFEPESHGFPYTIVSDTPVDVYTAPPDLDPPPSRTAIHAASCTADSATGAFPYNP